MTISLILVAGGKSTRIGPFCKTTMPLLGKPAILYSYNVFQTIPAIKEIVVVADPSHYSLLPNATFASPGNRRQDSVRSGFLALRQQTEYVMIHDGARPLIPHRDIMRLIDTMQHTGAAALASPVKNTLKKIVPSVHTIDRTHLWEVHTPQLIERALFARGLAHVQTHNLEVTDDLSMMEMLGESATLVPISFPNVKLTYPEDIPLVEALLTLK